MHALLENFLQPCSHNFHSRSDHRDATILRTAIQDFKGASAIAVHALPIGTVCIAGFYDAHASSTALRNVTITKPTENAADAVCDHHFQLSRDNYVSSIKRMHRTLLAHGVVGYQESCLDITGDSHGDGVSKVDAYLRIFEGSLAYEQPRVRCLLRMRPEVGAAEILDCMKQLQVRFLFGNTVQHFGF
jgi:hypothetical protein